jgi:hypothetical protein
MIKSTRAFLLAGASALAILASAAEANAETFVFTGGQQTFTASVSGEYAVELLGASGGNAANFGSSDGGLGAEVSGAVFLTAGEDLTLFVGGQGGSGTNAGGGGGGSFVFLGTDVFNGTDVLAVAGGGGGGGVGGTGLSGGGAGGGGSYLARLFTDQVLTMGGASRGDGSISIDFLPPAVPEPSTWAMMLAGFAGLGWLAHARRRKTSAA